MRGSTLNRCNVWRRFADDAKFALVGKLKKANIKTVFTKFNKPFPMELLVGFVEKVQ